MTIFRKWKIKNWNKLIIWCNPHRQLNWYYCKCWKPYEPKSLTRPNLIAWHSKSCNKISYLEIHSYNSYPESITVFAFPSCPHLWQNIFLLFLISLPTIGWPAIEFSQSGAHPQSLRAGYSRLSIRSTRRVNNARYDSRGNSTTFATRCHVNNGSNRSDFWEFTIWYLHCPESLRKPYGSKLSQTFSDRSNSMFRSFSLIIFLL